MTIPEHLLYPITKEEKDWVKDRDFNNTTHIPGLVRWLQSKDPRCTLPESDRPVVLTDKDRIIMHRLQEDIDPAKREWPYFYYNGFYWVQ
jgi:hypothetical protein